MDTNASHQTEKELLGAILKDGSTFARVIDVLPVDAFSSVMCADIYKAMRDVYEAGLTIDAVTVGDQLERRGRLVEVYHDIFTGRLALGKLRELGHPKNVASYALNVSDYYGKRTLTTIAGTVAEWSANGRRANAIITDARKLLDELETGVGAGNSRAVSAAEVASRSYDEAVSASGGGDKNYLPTGITALDKWFKLRRKNLTIVAARPSQGKTAFLVTIALNNALDKVQNNRGGKVLFISMEMSVEELGARFTSQLSGIPASRIIDGQMSEEEWESYTQAIERLESLKDILIISDVAAMTLAQIRNEARIHLTGENNLLLVDYLQLASSGKNKQNRVDEVGEIARGLKILAQDRDLSVLAAAQLSRSIETRADKRPMLSDLRESGSIEQDANNVLFLYRDEGDDIAAGSVSPVQTRKIIVAKQRNGATSYDVGKGDVIVSWNSPIMRFENVDIRTISL